MSHKADMIIDDLKDVSAKVELARQTLAEASGHDSHDDYARILAASSLLSYVIANLQDMMKTTGSAA